MTKNSVGKSEKRLLCLADLKERGWTEAGIKKFLGDPDQMKKNPRYRSASPMRLFLEARVVKSEGSAEYQNWQAASQKRRKAAQESAKKKKAQLLDSVRELEIELPALTKEELTRRACRHYNELWVGRGELDKGAGVNDAPEFLARIAANYLRHGCSKYEDELERLFGKVGTIEAKGILFERILARISELYPFLADECKEQVRRRKEEAECRMDQRMM